MPWYPRTKTSAGRPASPFPRVASPVPTAYLIKMRRHFQTKLAEHFELILTVAGVLVAIALTVAGLELGRERMAFIFLVWLQGFILWAVRRHSQLGRRQLLARLRIMLQDRVNNQLTVMLAMGELGRESGVVDNRIAVERAVLAARAVSEELADLSVDSLRRWEDRYGETRELSFRKPSVA